ncbi:DUF3060 domain-containing protein [Streptomyces phyllanthi]|uniref:DUF3060 domain-containing protein n=1 Tax=Streptomyces phyllanthi TaxID=1803180 RepID=A0A5N8VYF6_9ACTN|nr:DUF3060 domain-containing protein [Streptomyces phyllanthi]MPY39852.1 DUF3060 domain-containing protein [Streptomyces phyllanthi]
MRLSTLLPAATVTLALTALTGCSVDVNTPATGTATSQSPTAGVKDADTDTDSPTPSSPATPSDTKQLRFSGTNVKESADCTGRDVTADIDAGALILEGQCGTITIIGASSAVVVEFAEAIKIDGDANEVTVRTAGSITVKGMTNFVSWVRAADGDQPEVVGEGDYNQVAQVGEAQYEKAASSVK